MFFTFHYAYIWSIVLSSMLHLVNYHWTSYIEYLISLHNLSCILLLLWRMNHLTLCSNSNHLWCPLIILKNKVHVSFITFILEDEYRLSLGTLMHVKCIHELCIIILIFQSYLHHIRVISWFYNDFGNISQFSYFFGINPALAENTFL